MGFQEMGIVRCDGCGEEFFIGHNPQSVDRGLQKSKQNGWRKFWRKSTSAIGNTPTESNYQISSLPELIVGEGPKTHANCSRL